MEAQKTALSYLKTTRDELKLKAHLFEAELKDKWGELERKWEYFYDNEIKPPMEAAKEASENISAANQLVLDEIAEGYENIKSSLK